MDPDELAYAARCVSRHDDPIRIAWHYGVAVYAVPHDRLYFRWGQYMRAGAVPVIHVDSRLLGVARRAVVGHELAHHLVWWYGLSVRDEESFCDAVSRSFVRIGRLSAMRHELPKAVRPDEPSQVVEPLRYGLVGSAFSAA
jgi:hypothetical protein